MKITINESPDYKETEIVINCPLLNADIERLVCILRGVDERIKGVVDGITHLIEPKDIFYFESVDKKTFMYTKAQVMETPLRLYEIEEKLGQMDFFRASKSTIINISKIKKLSPRFNGRLDVLLENDEKLVISRQYVPIVKEILGL